MIWFGLFLFLLWFGLQKFPHFLSFLMFYFAVWIHDGISKKKKVRSRCKDSWFNLIKYMNAKKNKMVLNKINQISPNSRVQWHSLGRRRDWHKNYWSPIFCYFFVWEKMNNLDQWFDRDLLVMRFGLFLFCWVAESSPLLFNCLPAFV